MVPRELAVADALQAQEWLLSRAIPLWLDKGVDRSRGGFFDALDPVTLSNVAEIKRLRVITRQLYVLSQGARRRVAGAREAIDSGLEYLFDCFAHPDGGFASCCNLAGEITDSTRDLYDMAFVLFALAHAHGVTGDAKLRDEALKLLDFIHSALAHPAGGYLEAEPARYPRRQNPHMHLLEAALACAEEFGDACFHELADELVTLFALRLCDPGRGLVFEYFHEDLVQPIKQDGRSVVEPGHHFEWAWLLSEYKRVRGKSALETKPITEFALAHGLDCGTGLLVGELFDDGSVAMADVRIWPHCEWLRAAVVLGDAAGGVPAAWDALRRFLDTPVSGAWYERWSARRGAFEPGPLPASSLYHITSAIVAWTDRIGERAVGGG